MVEDKNIWMLIFAWLTHQGLNKMAAILQTTILNVFL